MSGLCGHWTRLFEELEPNYVTKCDLSAHAHRHFRTESISITNSVYIFHSIHIWQLKRTFQKDQRKWKSSHFYSVGSRKKKTEKNAEKWFSFFHRIENKNELTNKRQRLDMEREKKSKRKTEKLSTFLILLFFSSLFIVCAKSLTFPSHF